MLRNIFTILSLAACCNMAAAGELEESEKLRSETQGSVPTTETLPVVGQTDSPGGVSGAAGDSGTYVSRGKRARSGSWSFGGSLGMSFGDYTSINIAPQVSYNWGGNFTLGGGFSYNYYDHRDDDYSLNYLGAFISGRYYPVRYVNLYVQPEVQRRWGSAHGEANDDKVFMCLLLGAGVSVPVGDRSNLNITLYYDVLQDDYSPHGNKIGYSVGYTFRF